MGKTEIMQFVENLVERKEFPEFKAGDTITVHYKIKEGNKERIQNFQGVVLQRSGSGATETFTVRKIANGVGVERIFPFASPFIEQIDVTSTALCAAPVSSICATSPVRKPVSRRKKSASRNKSFVRSPCDILGKRGIGNDASFFYLCMSKIFCNFAS